MRSYVLLTASISLLIQSADPTSHRHVDGIRRHELVNSPTQLFDVDASIDPCDDFYKYTCANYRGNGVINDIDEANWMKLLFATTTEPENGKNVSEVEAKFRRYFNQCRQDLDDFNLLLKDGHIIKSAVADLESALGVKFPWVSVDGAPLQDLTPAQVGRALGLLTSRYDTSALLGASEFSDVLNPDKGHSLELRYDNFALDVPFPDDDTAKAIALQVYKYLRLVFDVEEAINRARKVKEEALRLIRFERILREATREAKDFDSKNETRNYPTIRLADFIVQFPQSIDIRAFLEGLTVDVPEARSKVLNGDFDLIIGQPKGAFQFLSAFSTIKQKAGLQPQDLINYIFYCLLMMRGGLFLPEVQGVDSTPFLGDAKDENPSLVAQKYFSIPSSMRSLMKRRNLRANDIACLYQATNAMPLAAEDLFIRAIYTTDKIRDAERSKLAQFTESVSLNLRAMLGQATWLTPKSKSAVSKKLSQLLKVIAFQNVSISPDELKDRYSGLKFTNDDFYPDMLFKATQFRRRTELSRLALPVFDRTFFIFPAFLSQMFYVNVANSLEVPLSLLQSPLYDTTRPASVNYGALGTWIGNRLARGFDDIGAQWEGDGRLRTWMDSASLEGLRKSSSCLVDQFDHFCFADGRCVNGTFTQAENLAEHVGLRAGYRAHSSSIKGLDSRIQLEYDRLFFLSYARAWCSPDDGHDSVEFDVVPPAPFRILGALQNFAAFRRAFRCPEGAKYAPKKRCDAFGTDLRKGVLLQNVLTD